ncbi:MAG TPA: ABC transporter ATP-binding protein [Bacteroidia bacterium]|nr:ABC transporter ATP-binding protein [Bacteroidia bacterium]HNT79136.1 ABC transporter ATP-binding protein [Bacteroidia bacterium]
MKDYVRLLAYVKEYKGPALLNVLFNVFSVLFSLFSLTMVVPFLNVLFNSTNEYQKVEWSFSVEAAIGNFNYFLHHYIEENGKLQALMFICMLVVVMFFFKNLFRYMAMYFLATVRLGIVKDVRNRLYNKTMLLPLGFFSNERKGDIMSRISNDAQELEYSIMSSLEVIFREPLTVVLFLLTMFMMSFQLTLFVIILLPLAGILIGRIGKSLRRTSSKAQAQFGALLSNIEETLGGLRIIKAFTAEQNMSHKFNEQNTAFSKTMRKAYRKRDLASPMSEFMGAAVMVVVMYFGGQLVLRDGPVLQPAEFIAFIAIFSQLIPPAKAFTTAYYNIQKGLASAQRINTILDAPVSIQDDENAISKNKFDRSIEYNNILFAYSRGDEGYVLKNINLSIEKGKTIALVGQSGSGKTTLADLLPRFYDPADGAILLDGIDIRKIALNDLRNMMGIVTQEAILFNDTVFNNITFGKPNSTYEEVIQAAQIANAHEFIEQMPDGYNTNIGDRGSKLSGGQRQRLSIARAVLMNPPILILDEATSALDTESERLVQEALTRLMKNRTTLVIAHRLSTIQHADEIIVMQKGEIIERGNHTALIERNGVYRRLSELQTFN